MPEELALSRTHRRIEEAVAEASALLQGSRRALEILSGGVRTVEEERVVVRPDLRVLRHRLAVEAEVVGVRGEERDGDLVREPAVGGERLVSRDALPAVRAGDVRDDAVAVRVMGRPLLVQPPGLRDAELVPLLAPREEVKERDLHRVRQRDRQVPVERVLEDDERRGARDEAEPAREVRSLDGSRQARERLERDDGVDAVERRVGEDASTGEGGQLAGLCQDPHAGQGGISIVGGPREEALELRLVREATPERSGGAVVARAEERPADVSLVVLRPGERERHREDERVVGQSAPPGRIGEGRGPRRVAFEQRVRERVGLAADQLA